MFYELPNIKYLTDEEFESIFECFKLSVTTEKGYWIHEWYRKINPDSIVTYIPPNSNRGMKQFRQFRTNTYTKKITEETIFETEDVRSCPVSTYRGMGERSYLYKIGEYEAELVPDDAPNDPRQLTEHQISRVLEFCEIIDNVDQL